MQFTIRSVSQFREIIVESDNTKITYGLLNEEESVDLAKSLILAAEDLLPSDCDGIEKDLIKIREKLERRMI